MNFSTVAPQLNSFRAIVHQFIGCIILAMKASHTFKEYYHPKRVKTSQQDASGPWKRLGPPLAEWMLQIKDKVVERGLRGHADAIESSLSAFKAAEKYSEATMWGKLVASTCS